MDFLPHPFTHAVEEGTSSRQNNVLEKVFPDIYIALLDWGIAVLMHTVQVVESRLFWAKQDFGSHESLGSY